jgi:putative nucleotidyltransferase with HDIG domain
MRLISIDEYNYVTMQLAKPIFDRHRRVLLAAGRKIHPKFLERLKELDFRYIFVEDAVSEGITLDEMVDMPDWMDAIEVMEKTFQTVKKQELIQVKDLQSIVTKLVAEVSKRKLIVLMPATSLAEELRPFAHAVNVALLSLQTAKKLKFNPSQMQDIGMGALLHDIGKALTDRRDEHPSAGFELLRKQREISLLSAHMAYQHHETMDGKGFPRGEQQIHDFAQICGLADLYENYISKEELPPHEAIELLMTKSCLYKPSILQAFVETVPPYPPGTKVQLSNGEKAIVTKIIDHPHRPTVRILSTKEELSLADHHSMIISNYIKETPQIEPV